MRFVAELVIFNAIAFIVAIPVVRINMLLKRFKKPRTWRIAGFVCATVAAIIGWSSRILVEQCLSEINDGCIDIGGQGLQFVIMAGYVVAALSSYKMTKDS